MLVIKEIMEDLKETAEEFISVEISQEEFDLKVDLLITRINRIEINFIDTKIHTFQTIFNRLLFKAKFRATEALNELREADNTRIFNARIRNILAAQVYFKSLHRTITRNMYGYRDKHGYHLQSDIQIFIERKENEHE